VLVKGSAKGTLSISAEVAAAAAAVAIIMELGISFAFALAHSAVERSDRTEKAAQCLP
jgi:hypothetical protein